MSRVNLFTGADAVKYIINHAEVSAVFCTQDKLQTVSSPSCIFYFVAFSLVSGSKTDVLNFAAVKLML